MKMLQQKVLQNVSGMTAKKTEYQMSFDETKINYMFNTLSSINANTITQDSMENIAKHLKEAFLEPAKATGMYKEKNWHK